MKSPVLFSEKDFDEWTTKECCFGSLRPSSYPCIVTADRCATLQEVVHFADFPHPFDWPIEQQSNNELAS